MTEIPEHLLNRGKARKAALGKGDAGDAGAGASVPATTGSTAAAVPASNLPKGPVAPAGGVEVAKAAPKADPHYVQAYKARHKIPVWVMPMVAALPLWGFFYAGTLEPPPTTEVTLLGEGGTVYGAVCSSCHGATGGGAGSAPQLSEGNVINTFPDPVEQVRWVILGSNNGPVNGQYGATGKASVGGMPTYGGVRTLEEIVAAVLYERQALSLKGAPMTAEEAEKWAISVVSWPRKVVTPSSRRSGSTPLSRSPRSSPSSRKRTPTSSSWLKGNDRAVVAWRSRLAAATLSG